jgi:predicted nucleotidyltransferase
MVLLRQQDGVTGRGLATLLSATTFKTHYAVKYLTSLGVLLQTVQGKACVYRLNTDHILFKKVFLPLIRFQENIFTDLGGYLVSFLRPRPLSIVLYGSVARGDETPQSDIDLLFVTKEGTSLQPQIEQASLYEKILKRYGNAMTFHEMSASAFIKRFKEKESLVTCIVKEGLVVYGQPMTDILTSTKKVS